MTIDYVKCRTQDLEIPDENLKQEKDGFDKQAKEKVAQLTKEVVAKYESFTEREENVGNKCRKLNVPLNGCNSC